jgi:hypothetical protein
VRRDLSPVAARRLRYDAHLLGGSELGPAAVVDRAVALQGQDLPAVLRAIALRCRPGTTVADVRGAFDAGTLVRSWPMRGTLFATTPRHLAALLSSTAERTRRAAARRRVQLGLDDATIGRACDVLTAALAERPMVRADVLQRLEDAGIGTTAGRGYHVLMHLAVSGLVHWGPFDDTGTQQHLVLSRPAPPPDPEAGLADAVRGFVAARGPVGERDLAWWTKLPLSVLRRAAGRVEELTEVSVDGAPAWVLGEPGAAEPSGVTLVPAFDEWVLGYADRSLVASPRTLAALVPGGNGVFRPAVLVDGRVVGTWRRSTASRSVRRRLSADLLEPVPGAVRDAVDRALEEWPHG